MKIISNNKVENNFNQNLKKNRNTSCIFPKKNFEQLIFKNTQFENKSHTYREFSKIKLSSPIIQKQKPINLKSPKLNSEMINLEKKNGNQYFEFLIPFSQRISIINHLENKINRIQSTINKNKPISKSTLSILHKSKKKYKEKIYEEYERINNTHRFIRSKKNKRNLNGEINDDIRSRLNLCPIENSYGKKLEIIIKNINFIQSTTNIIFPKLTKTSLFLGSLSKLKDKMLENHCSVDISNKLYSEIFKYNKIKRNVNLISKYPIRIGKMNMTFYKNKKKPLIYNEFYNNNKYDDLVL